ncbi:hypothetical protein C1H46_030397 [Malus baccata]|uniref:Pentatricopeptide repeat-containing protein n=1 Tax=Malus baccata TaxID=106549 RepID=A0A540LC68_MALBA|nr:hypothetical protein C1H46_030397 [Malus baccata]
MPIATMLIASYFKKNRSREAFKMFNWLVRPGSQCVLDERVCEILVNGFCRKGMVCEGLKVLRAMLGVNIVPGGDGRKWVYRGLLREARIKEAVELNEALGCGRVGANGDESEGVKKKGAAKIKNVRRYDADHSVLKVTDTGWASRGG